MDRTIRILLMGRKREGSWTIRVEDNGPGISEPDLLDLRGRLEEIRRGILERGIPAEMEIGGMGIVNTYARCLLLYSEDLLFEMENVPHGQGFCVTVGQKTLVTGL